MNALPINVATQSQPKFIEDAVTITEDTDRLFVLRIYPTAGCSSITGGYQILSRKGQSGFPPPPGLQVLSSRHDSKEEAWMHAAARLRILEQVKAESNLNRVTVLTHSPGAYCAAINQQRFQIRRDRRQSDSESYTTYTTLSGRFSTKELAWQDAAYRLRGE